MKQLKSSLLKLLEVTSDVGIFLYQINKHPSPILVDILNKRLENNNASHILTMDKFLIYSLQVTLLPVSFDAVVYKFIMKLLTIKDVQIMKSRQVSVEEMIQMIQIKQRHQHVALFINTHLFPNPLAHESVGIFCMLPFMMLSPLSVQQDFNFPKILSDTDNSHLQIHYKQAQQKHRLAAADSTKSQFYHFLFEFTDAIYHSIVFFSNIPTMQDVLDMQLFYLKADLEFNLLASPFNQITHLEHFQYLRDSKYLKDANSGPFGIIGCTPSNEFMSSAHEKPYVVYYESISLTDLELYWSAKNTVETCKDFPNLSQMMSTVQTATYLFKESKFEYQPKIVENLKKSLNKWKIQWKGSLSDSYADLSDVKEDRMNKNTFQDVLFNLSLGSPFSHIPSYHIIPMLHKPGDLRQEKFALQLIGILKDIFEEEGVGESLFEGGLASGLTVYEIICCSGNGRVPEWLTQHPELFEDLEIVGNGRQHGLIELCVDTISVHKATEVYGSFNKGFAHLFGTQINAAHYKFLFSLVSYSIATWLFNIKDRHNSNILLHKPTGQLIHIDFGFFFNLIPGTTGIGGLVSGGSGFEQAPFKLHSDYIEILGGIPKELKNKENRMNLTTPTVSVDDLQQLSQESREYLQKTKMYGSTLWTDFTNLMVHGFKAVKKHHRKLVDLVHLMETADQPLPCFTGKPEKAQEVVHSPIFNHGRFAPELQRSNSVPAGLGGSDINHNRYVSSPVLNNERVERHSRQSTASSFTTTRPSSRASSQASRKSVTATPVTDGLRDRCFVQLTDEKLQEQVSGLIDSSVENVFTILYDQYQRISNGIL